MRKTLNKDRWRSFLLSVLRSRLNTEEKLSPPQGYVIIKRTSQSYMVINTQTNDCRFIYCPYFVTISIACLSAAYFSLDKLVTYYGKLKRSQAMWLFYQICLAVCASAIEENFEVKLENVTVKLVPYVNREGKYKLQLKVVYVGNTNSAATRASAYLVQSEEKISQNLANFFVNELPQLMHNEISAGPRSRVSEVLQQSSDINNLEAKFRLILFLMFSETWREKAVLLPPLLKMQLPDQRHVLQNVLINNATLFESDKPCESKKKPWLPLCVRLHQGR